jgi:hypothetical protein
MDTVFSFLISAGIIAFGIWVGCQRPSYSFLKSTTMWPCTGLINCDGGSVVRVRHPGERWPEERVKALLKDG